MAVPPRGFWKALSSSTAISAAGTLGTAVSSTHSPPFTSPPALGWPEQVQGDFTDACVVHCVTEP